MTVTSGLENAHRIFFEFQLISYSSNNERIIMKPLVTEYLKTHTLKELRDDHGINVRFSKDMSKFVLDYDQIDAKFGDPVSEQCRGLILRPVDQCVIDQLCIDEKERIEKNLPKQHVQWRQRIIGETVVVAWPMNRFYNHGTPYAKIDWNDPDLRALEKLDGTMCILYWDDVKHQWCVGTRGVPEADVEIYDGKIVQTNTTFSKLFWSAVDDREMFTNRLDKQITYVFELTSKYNRVVVKYDAPRITLLARRNIVTGRELTIDDGVEPRAISRPISYHQMKMTPDVINAFVNAFDPMNLEGVVVIDSSFNRVKIKSAAWVLASRMKGTVRVMNGDVIKAIIDGTIDDVVPLLDADDVNFVNEIRVGLSLYLSSIDKNFEEFKRSSTTRKEFAKFVVSTKDWTSPYFAMWDGTYGSSSEYVKVMASKNQFTSSVYEILLSKAKNFI